MNRAEILAPAGSFDALKAVVSGGCDAVYLGGSRFGARAYAQNFDGEELLRAIDYCHLHGKKLYLTVNTLFKEQELEELAPFLHAPYEQGLDAVIVQDLGALKVITEEFPALSVHASTQMTLTQTEDLFHLKHKNITRFVPARELSLDEIKALRAGTDLEIECFVHGALCYCYSGQCLMSSLIGGRSGNRGRCAQPCRRFYSFGSKEGYLISPKDLCTIGMVPELLRAGIDSFKIEGRMKSPSYAAFTAYAYRYAEDLALEGKPVPADLEQKLLELYNRGGSTKGYYVAHNGRDMMSVARPNHNGVCVGEVTGFKAGKAEISLKTKVSRGDVLEFRDGGNSLYEFTLGEASLGAADHAERGQKLSARLYKGLKCQKGTAVFRTRNALLLSEIEKDILANEAKSTVDMYFSAHEGVPVVLNAKALGVEASVSGGTPEPAKQQGAGYDSIKKQLQKLGDTEFCLGKLEADISEGLFLPVSELNNLRRAVIEELRKSFLLGFMRKHTASRDTTGAGAISKAEEAVKEYNCTESRKAGKTQHQIPVISVKVTDKEQLHAAFESDASEVILPLEDFGTEGIKAAVRDNSSAGKKLFISLPQICRKKEFEYISKELTENSELINETAGFIVRTFGELSLVKKLFSDNVNASKKLVLDYNHYVMNSAARDFYRGLAEGKSGFELSFTAPVELSALELSGTLEKSDYLIAYGYQTVMTSANCLFKTTGRCDRVYGDIDFRLFNMAKDKKFDLLYDEKGHKLLVKRSCAFCVNSIYNSDCLDLSSEYARLRALSPYSLRLDFTTETEAETAEVIRHFTDIVHEKKEPCRLSLAPHNGGSYTKGHLLRGVE